MSSISINYKQTSNVYVCCKISLDQEMNTSLLDCVYVIVIWILRLLNLGNTVVWEELDSPLFKINSSVHLNIY